MDRSSNHACPSADDSAAIATRTSHVDLQILLEQGEGTTLEYKEALSESFVRELVAMANTRGGRILLGVRDDGTIATLSDSNRLRARIQDIARNCDPAVEITVESVERVVVVHVLESDSKPVQCREGFFTRTGAVTQKLTRDRRTSPAFCFAVRIAWTFSIERISMRESSRISRRACGSSNETHARHIASRPSRDRTFRSIP